MKKLSKFSRPTAINRGVVPGAGIEPARCFHRGILSPLRLPISPSGHFEGMVLLGLLLKWRLESESNRR